jgi:hypothetical protein
MPGAWEEGGQKVLVAILTREVVTSGWAFGLRKMFVPPAGGVVSLYGMPYDHARNSACRSTLENGFTWLFFLDDDVIPPPDVIPRLISHGKDIVSGVYYRRNEPIVPCMQRLNKDGNPEWVTSFGWPGLIEVDHVGAGCLLIHRRVLEKLQKPGNNRPWFEWLCDHEDLPKMQKTSEDFTFCRRAREAGYKINVDTAVHCVHAGNGRAVLTQTGGVFTPFPAEA